MNEGLVGKAAIVTGAARGAGLAVARRLVRAGAFVLMADQDERRLAVEAAALNDGDRRGRAAVFCCDLRERLDMTNLLAAALEAQDRLDMLVDANLLAAASDLLDPAADGLEAALTQNVTARLRLAQLAARRMAALAEAEMREDGNRQDRAILFLGPSQGPDAPADLAALAASAAALAQVARGLALRLAPSRVRVNVLAAVEPSRQDTETALPEGADPEAAAEAAAFLVSPAARAITGQTLAADCGRGLASLP